jgi:hypothetical protein
VSQHQLIAHESSISLAAYLQHAPSLKMREVPDLDQAILAKTCVLTALPCELLIQVLKELRSLRQLQAAIVASHFLFAAYQSSRTIIRQQVFLNESLDFCSQPITPSSSEPSSCSKCFNYRRVHSKIVQLEEQNPTDGLILRACIWNDILAHAKPDRNQAPSGIILTYSADDHILSVYAESHEVLIVWSLGLSSAYQRSNQHENSQRVGEQTLAVFMASVPASESQLHKLDLHIMAWLSSMMASYAVHRQFDAGLTLFQGVWDYFYQEESDQAEVLNSDKLILELIKSLEWFCVGSDPRRNAKFYEVEAHSWQFLHRHISRFHADGSFCVYCSSTATSLTSTTRLLHTDLEVLIAYQKSIWRDLPPRSLIFANWSRVLLQTLASQGKQLEGSMIVWQRLQESQDVGTIDSFDLGQARHVISVLNEAGKTREACEIQASVFPKLEPGTGQYFAWGRKLSEAYVIDGQINEAITIAEQMCDGLSPSSRFYTTWTRELSKLHKISQLQKDGQD